MARSTAAAFSTCDSGAPTAVDVPKFSKSIMDPSS
jgi:hypothetical protein